MATGVIYALAAGGDLLRVQALHGRRPDRRRRQELTGSAMASVAFRNVEKRFGEVKVIHGIELRHRRRRVHGARRAVGLRQVDAAAHARGARGDQRRHDRHRRPGRQRRRVEGPRHRDGVPELRALPAHDRRPEHGLQHAAAPSRPEGSPPSASPQAAKILNLGPYLDRYPRELSGGQRQRVAMGRAIVRDPKVFLFDEPLSNLDAKLRVAMRAEIKALHQRLKTTTVYVTHDQVEAMTMADRIVVMHDGRIEQIGTPLELYDRPANLFVAQFIGSPAMNIVEGTLRRGGDGSWVEAEGGLRWPVGATGAGVDGQPVVVRRPPRSPDDRRGSPRRPGRGRRRRADRRRDRAAGAGRRQGDDRRHPRPDGGVPGRPDRARRRRRRGPSLRSGDRPGRRRRKVRLRLTP